MNENGNGPSPPPPSGFGAELRRLRTRAGMTQDQVARAVGYKFGSVSTWELGRAAPPLDVVRSLDATLVEALGLTEPTGLVDLWTDYTRTRGVAAHLRDDVALGERARSIEVVTPTLVPGLLQAPEYARRVLAAGRPSDSVAVVDRLVAARCRVLDGLDARIKAVFPVAALQAVPDAARVQARHLLDLVDTGQVAVHLVPPPGLVGVGAPFTIYVLRDGTQKATTENALGSVGAEPPEVVFLLDIARACLGYALPPDHSVRILKEAV